MTSESDKCGISSILPMSCRNRAEDFARRLQSRLRSLGSQDGNSSDENSWLAANETPVAVSQPRHSDSDLYFDFGLLESPGSPEEELNELDYTRFPNKDNLEINHCEECQCSKVQDSGIGLNNDGPSNSQDSDSSDGVYYDPDSDVDQKIVINHVNGLSHNEGVILSELNAGDKWKNEEECKERCYNENECNEENYLSIQSVSEEDSTLSLRDEDYPSGEFSNCIQEVSREENENKQIECENLKEENGGICPKENSFYYLNENKISDSNERGCKNDNETKGQNSCKSNDTKYSIDNEKNEYVWICGKIEKNQCLERDYNNGSEKDIERENSVNDFSIQIDYSFERNTIDNYNNTSNTNKSSIDIDWGESTESSTVDKTICSSLNIPNICEVNQETDNIEEDEGRPPRVRRCSSLKTGKTPPGTPGRKKIVRFADVLGLDLADVRTFLDEIPKIPNSAYEDLIDVDLSSSPSDVSLCSFTSKYAPKIEKVLVPLFQQPGGQMDFLDRVAANQVCLENAMVDDPVALSIKGTVRVRNLDFNKSVHIRYSLDSWKSFADLQGQYVPNSCDGFSDKFSFLLYAHTLVIGQRLEFAVRFHCKGCQYWDNNRGANYCFQCLPASNNTPYMPIMGPEDIGAAFY